MKLALRYIPTEVWVDIFCHPWISRKQLGKIVAKFRNRYFAEILQYCLHERGKRTLTELVLDKETIIPRTLMPENIKSFKRIKISHFDSSTLDFLRQISTLFTDNDVNLRFGFKSYDDLANLRFVLDHLAPLLHGIRSMEFNHRVIPLVEQYLEPKLAQVKMLTLYFDHILEQLDPATIQTRINFCMNWLTSEERDPTEPRLLWVHFCCAEMFQQFCMAVRKQFLSAKNPCTFAIGFICCDNLDQLANLHLENSLGEQFDGQILEDEDFEICRHKKADFARTQLIKWAEKTAEKSAKSSGIDIVSSVTIGQIDANDANEVNERVDEEGKDKPTTSG